MEHMKIILTWNTCILHWHGTRVYYTDKEQMNITLTWNTWTLYWHGTSVYYTDMEDVYITLTRNTWILHWHGTHEHYTDMEHVYYIDMELSLNFILDAWPGHILESTYGIYIKLGTYIDVYERKCSKITSKKQNLEHKLVHFTIIL